ncbi:MFS transporter [Pseudomonas sp. WMBT8]|uniref:MFS transporter n=1 Tax=Pseudomonas sp. WMBT8 TaxID=3414496 RepID=UPI003D8038C0
MNTTFWWPRQLLIGWINLALTAPLIYLFIGLPLVMREHGWSATQIGLMQMTGLPALGKFLLATPIDRWQVGRNNYRNWGMLLGVGYIATLLLLGLHDLAETPFALLFVLAMAVSLFGTWVDLPINALAIRMLPQTQRMQAGAIRSTATSLAAIIGGGLMLILHSRTGWAAPLYVLSLGVLSAVLLLPLLRTPTTLACPVPEERDAFISRPSMGQWLAWFTQPGHRTWTVLLILYFPLIGTVWVFLKPLMLDQGFSPERIAQIVGVGGGVVAAFSSLAGSYVSRKWGVRVALPLFAAGNLLTLGTLVASTLLCWGPDAMAFAALLVALMMGASGGLVFGLMMYHVRPGLSALDYGIQSSLFVAGRTLLPILAGVLLDHTGYSGLFGCLLAALGLMLAYLLGWSLRAPRKPASQTPSPTQSVE